MKAIDLLFYLNYKHRDRELGYMMLALLIMSMSLGFLGMLKGLGLDAIDALIKAYPLGVNDNVRSIFNRRAGPAILFVFPAILFFCVTYAMTRAKEVIRKYDLCALAASKWVVASYSTGMILSTFVIAVVSRDDWPILGFLAQIAVVAFFHLVVVDGVLRRFSTIARNH